MFLASQVAVYLDKASTVTYKQWFTISFSGINGENVLAYFVQKGNETFVVTDELGNIYPEGEGLGLYYHDMRYISVLDLRINGLTPSLLSTTAEQGPIDHLQLANPTITLADGRAVLPNTISIRRKRSLDNYLEERIGLVSYNRFPVSLQLSVEFGSDFRDMFDVRGLERGVKGTIIPPSVDTTEIVLGYSGLDGLRRHSDITFSIPPSAIEQESKYTFRARRGQPGASLPDLTVYAPRDVILPPTVKVIFNVVLQPRVPWYVDMHIRPREGQPGALQPIIRRVEHVLEAQTQRWLARTAVIETANEVFNCLLERSILDLRALTQEHPTGLLPIAGLPWFATPFGRDSLVTSMETMILSPDLAVGTLKFLAKYQGTTVNDWRDEQPGKIMHELRLGEMANLGEIPHTPYFGSVDSTPLFLMLFSETMRWLDDADLYAELLPGVMAALDWIDEYGDLDGDGYVEYEVRSPRGIRNQSWKDSFDSIQYPDGTPATPPITAVEVQGYVYAAKMGIAELLERHGETGKALRLRAQAMALRENFNRDFWLEQEGFFAQALDSNKVPIHSITSNPGHCLFTGIISDDKAERVIQRLLERDMAAGWGIRTLSSKMPGFNPMSYHNGSVWPHDNALAAAGMKRYGHHDGTTEVASQLFSAGARFPNYRLPELFCGFGREARFFSVPAEYPVRCSPQAWASGAPLLLLQAFLGLSADARLNQVYVRPKLPLWLSGVIIRHLRIGSHRVDLHIQKDKGETEVSVLKNEGGVDVIVEKPETLA